MSIDPRELDTFAEATRASQGSVDRVRQGIDRAVPSGQAVGEVLSAHLPPADPAAVARVKAGVLAARPSPPSPLARAARLGGIATVVAALVGGVGVGWSLLSGPVPLDAPLSAAVEPAGELVLTAVDGRGHLGGTTDAPEVTWEAGALAAEGHGIVRTREAVIRLVGEPATVTRDLTGTDVQGTAQVDCLAPDAADAAPCPPVSAAGRLALAEARRDAGAPPVQVLDVIDSGLALADDPAVRAELRAARVATLFDLGRTDDLLDEARRVLDDGTSPRLPEVARRAAATALSQGDCAAAVPFLEHLAPTDADAAVALERCR